METSIKLYKHIPNLITSLSLISGCTAILLAFHVDLMVYAPWFIILSAILDFLDGMAARLLKAYSEIGKQLDSLADVIAFGVAPAMITVQILRMSLVNLNSQFDLPGITFSESLILGSAFLLPVFSALRLAKFNIDDSQKYSFKGLPTPAAGLTIAFLVLTFFHTERGGIQNLFLLPWFMPLIILLLGLLMVSPFRMISFKFKSYRLKENFPRYLVLIGGAICIGFWLIPGCLFALLLYILISLFTHFLNIP